jgi:hypothetical protein
MVVICKIVSLDINYGRFVCRRGCAVAGVQEDFLFDSCLESGFDTFLLLGLVGIMRIWFACLKDHVFSFVLGRGVCWIVVSWMILAYLCFEVMFF